MDAAAGERGTEIHVQTAQGGTSAGSGAAERNDGKGDTSRPGQRKEIADEHGGERPSWHASAGAEIAELRLPSRLRIPAAITEM